MAKQINIVSTLTLRELTYWCRSNARQLRSGPWPGQDQAVNSQHHGHRYRRFAQRLWFLCKWENGSTFSSDLRCWSEVKPWNVRFHLIEIKWEEKKSVTLKISRIISKKKFTFSSLSPCHFWYRHLRTTSHSAPCPAAAHHRRKLQWRSWLPRPRQTDSCTSSSHFAWQSRRSCGTWDWSVEAVRHAEPLRKLCARWSRCRPLEGRKSGERES